jgi:alpha-L-rhamnosidase/Polysaccharide lyase family 4, domain III/Polysaccharide lyase family 4, domain II
MKLPRLLTACLLALLGAMPALALDQASFKTPPPAARPTCWWFWGESVTTEHGITQDLEAMKRVGWGGVVLYEQVFSDAPDACQSLSPEFMARVRFAAAECARLGLSLELNVGPGYVAGGPWITPELGQQRLVSSELQIEGGRKISRTLPKPSAKLGFYRDVAVLAYPSPAGSETVSAPTLTSEPAGLDLTTMLDPNGKKVRIPPSPNGRSSSIQMDYRKPFTARSLVFSQRTNAKALIVATQTPGNWSDDNYGQGVRPYPPLGELEASDDGVLWEFVCSLPQRGFQLDGRERQTLAFPAKTARYFRLNLHGWGRNERYKDDDLYLGGVELLGEARLDQWEVKSANYIDFPEPDRTPAYTANEVIDPAKIVDLTDRLSPEGKLDWDAPPGRWTILRFGHTATGAMVKHGRPESKGLECDKMSVAAARVQFENYTGRILKEIRTVPGARLAGINVDSAEVGSQNWTTDFAAQFQARRGYELRRFLPAMAGRVVGSREQSDRFLTDLRRTCADLISDNYYGEFQRLCHANDMTVMAQTGIATPMPIDDIQAKGHADIPMCEFWLSQADGTLDCKETSSAAHVYGLPIVAAEAFTGSPSDVTPGKLKPLADNALALGVNRFVVLASIHQPWDDRKPGVTEDRYYLPYQRHNTWWEYSGAFWNTLSRSAYLMQEGRPVMDLLYHLGNDVPQKIAPARMRPAPPEGYDYDACGDEILLRAGVKDGRVVLPGGMSYRVLVLAGGDRLTLAVARQLRALVTQGAVVLASSKPLGSRSLADGTAGDAEVRKIADKLWGPGQPSSSGEQTTGRGKVIWGRTPAVALSELGVSKDFEAASAKPGQNILFAHRRSGTDEIYFVANHLGKPTTFNGLFRVQGKIPQAWNPETGEITALPGFTAKKDRIEVPLSLESYGSLFVVFRDEPAPKANAAAGLVGEIPVWKTLSGFWEVGFTPNAGAPEKLTFPSLISWSEHSDAGVRNYAGTATYVQEFDLPTVPAGRVVLDLGRVESLASVSLNGVAFGVLWKAPYAVDVTQALRPGKNRLEVKVVNVWANRLIADAGLPESKRVSWASYNPYKPGDPLLPAGLLGPVQLRMIKASAPSKQSLSSSVFVEDLPDAIRVENSEISVRFDKKNGRMTSLKRGERELIAVKGDAYLQFYAKEAAANERVKMSKEEDLGEMASVRVIRREPDLVEVSASSRLQGFDVEMHYVVRAGESGFYNYIVVRNDPANPPGERILEQVNFCLRADPEIFRYASIGEEKHGFLPRPQELKDDQKVMDASYRLPDGTIDAKYDWAMEETGGRVFGLMGEAIGLFLVKDSGEALNSGPVARELSVHQTTTTPVLLRHLVGGHYGRGNIKLTAADGKWAKLAGPWFIYVAEGKSCEDLWAKAQARAEQAVRDWPYQWMRDPLYPLARGTVSGRLEVGGDGVAAAGSLVFIGPTPTATDPDWQQSGKGYFFWTRVKADGTFKIEQAREGRYSLWVLNDAQFGEFRRDNVTVKAGEMNALGTLAWPPEVRGKIIWQIGRPDRTAKEFRHGDDYRHWGLWLKYPEEFPHDVDFKIGQSHERTDWNYVQPAIPNPDGTWRSPEWKIRFDMPPGTSGKGHLRIGVAGVSAHAGETTGGERWAGFEVRLNGELLQTCKYPHDGGSTRSGIGGNRYHEALIDFDAAKLKAGENTFSLTLTSAPPRGIAHNFPYCAVMYDALRLEIEAR